MIETAFRRRLSEVLASPKVLQRAQGEIDRGWLDKSADCRRAFLVGREGVTEHRMKLPTGAFAKMSGKSISREPSPFLSQRKAP
jgi:hypothetical protein